MGTESASTQQGASSNQLVAGSKVRQEPSVYSDLKVKSSIINRGSRKSLMSGVSAAVGFLRLPKPIKSFLTRHDGEVPSKKDLAVIMTLWTTELLRVAFETFQLRAVDDFFPRTSHKQLIFFWKLLTYGASLGLMFLLAIATSWWHKIKYWSFVSSMFRYFISPISGLFLSFRPEPYFAILLNLSTIFWYGAHPLRYSLVFHQYFPIHMTHSRRIITVNVILIWITRYVCFSWVTDVKHLSKYAFKVGWIAMLVVCPLWLATMCLLGRYRNKIPEKLYVVRNFYINEELKSFDRRQRCVTVFLVVLILYPGAIFTLLMTLSEQSLMLLAKRSPEVDALIAYRIDLIIAIVVAVLIELIFNLLKWTRSELFELTVIALAFMLKLSQILVTIPSVRNTFLLPEPNSWVPQMSMCKIVLFGMQNPKNIIVQIDEFVYFSNHDGDRLVFLANVPVTYSKVAPVRISLYPTGEVVHESDIELVSHVIFIYNFNKGMSQFRGSWIKARWTQNINASQMEPQLVVFNMMQECFEYDTESLQYQNKEGFIWDELSFGSRALFCPNICFPFRWTLEYKIKNQSVTQKNLSISHGYGLDSSPVSMPCVSNGIHCVGLYEMKPNNIRYQECIINKTWLSMEIFRGSVLELQQFSLYLIRLEQDLQSMNSCFGISWALVFNRTVTTGGISKEWTVLLLIFNSLPHIMAAVSYVHFMWMQLPIKRRTLIIYGYCSLEAIAEWIPLGIVKNLEYSDKLANLVVLVTACGTVWHMALSLVWVIVVWRNQTPKERKISNKRF